MDTELARTFLTVVSAGNFITAADRLHVSQSTVSTRIHTLEQQLGCTLFVRNKAGTTLTPAGRQFQRHASVLVRTVEQARQDVGIPKGFTGTLVVGGRIGLWEEYLLHWLPLMQATHPDISIRAESALEPELMQGLVEGRIDIGVMYTPQSRPGLKVEQLFDEQLILVSTDPKSPPEPGAGYVYVDWGPEFYMRHSTLFPNFAGSALNANIGWLGLQHLLENGGTGFFARRIVEPLLKAKRLSAVAGAPVFTLPAYVVYPSDRQDEHIASAVALMHRIAISPVRRDAEPPAVTKKSVRKRR
ncbi:LysR family transcriptional regulator [Bradyrhizobium lablabi]|uniref:LysR family transcriptional regulator n=1 Tax=Bradyrhizobium lablabi TaxID=722472 RepID=UPI001BAB6ED4|nr:LysR family transcriptional regulator [Bradyrhizobium lablabi]MBR0697151.1 LysR family transcriptional regulator [Bradyrhizobium lablabi]